MKRPVPFTQAQVRRAVKAVEPVVYFVEIGKYIKIGFTTNLPKRLKAFLNSAPAVEVLLAIPGDMDLERRLHNILVESRVERELYHGKDYRVLGFIRHFEQHGLDAALDYLEETTPEERAARKEASRLFHLECRRETKAEKDAYFASLVARRKERLGW